MSMGPTTGFKFPQPESSGWRHRGCARLGSLPVSTQLREPPDARGLRLAPVGPGLTGHCGRMPAGPGPNSESGSPLTRTPGSRARAGVGRLQ